MQLAWFDTRESILFAQEIVHGINQLFPPTPKQGRLVKAKKQKRKFDGLITRTRIFVSQHKLNFYKKAKILNTIKWEMINAGHDKDRIDEVLKLMIALLNNTQST